MSCAKEAVKLNQHPLHTSIYELGKDLVDPKELHNLSTRMRDLHNWYNWQSNVGQTMVRHLS
jgi:hypothetical protein